MSNGYLEADKQTRKSIKAMGDRAASLSSFTALTIATVNEGELSTKVKELMAFSISVAIHCEECVVYHLRNALQAGASEKEVYEAADVAIMMGGGPAVVHAAKLVELLPQLQEEAE